MAPKAAAVGKHGHKVQEYVKGLREEGLSETEIRQQLKRDGYKPSRISQLLKATRPAVPEESLAASSLPGPAPSSSMSARAAGDGGTAVGGSGQQGDGPLGRRMADDEEDAGEASEADADEEIAAVPTAANRGMPDEDGEEDDSDDGNNSELGVYDAATYWARFGPEAALETAELDHLDGQLPESQDAGGEVTGAEDEDMSPVGEPNVSSSEGSSDDDEAALEGAAVDAPMEEVAGAEAEHIAEAEQAAAAPAEQQPKRRRLRGKQPPPPAYALPAPQEPEAKSDEAPPPPESMKRPAAKMKRRARNEVCAGYDDEACCFSTAEAGEPARVHADRGEQHCLLCDKDKMERASKMTRRNTLTMTLKKLKALRADVFEQALARVKLFLGEDVAEDFAKRAGARPRPPARPPARPRRPATDWQALLEHRQPIQRALKPKEQEEFSKAVKRDQRVARRKLFFPEKLLKRAGAAEERDELEAVRQAGEVEDLAENDVGLPKPTEREAAMVENWCKQGSWAMCEKCHSMCPRPLQPVDLRQLHKGTISAKQCTACRNNEYVPQPEHVPGPLRNLKPKVLRALRPMEISTGPFERAPHGYRVHTAIFQTHWTPTSVVDQIEALRKRQDRRAARAAYEHLMADANSAYAEFIQKHDKFLAKYGDNAEESRRRRPLRSMEEEGLECCLWPHLYWHKNLCETVARATHEARRGRKPGRRRSATDSSSEEAEGNEGNADEAGAPEDQAEDALEGEEEEDGAVEIEEGKQGRIKRGFMRKVLSPIMGYGADYELLHFVYDLSLWTTVGTKRNLASRHGVALRHMLKGCPWTPEYWRVRHQAVIDMQRQCGNADLFRTRAPYERTFPYHRWVMHEQAALGKPRMHLPMAETLHMAHALMQLDKGYICGSMAHSGRQDRNWRGHVLGPADPRSSLSTVTGHVTRLEFQDGKRKRASQKYHGRGTVHSHSLDFLENVAAIGLERKLQATVPPKDAEPFMHGLVLDSQCDYKDSKLPIREEPSVYDPVAGKVLLRHTEADKDLHIRTYMKPTMAITKCHEDVQQGDGNGAVLHYVATYNTKFSSSMDREWLSGEASDYSTAAGLLHRHKPLEPEMTLTMAQERFSQFNISGTILDVMAPSLEADPKPAFVERYEEASWRREGMPLIEFLRKSNKDGDIIHHIQEKHKKQAMAELQAQLGEDDKVFAKRRQRLLSHYRLRQQELKRQGRPKQPLEEFLQQEGFHGITALKAFANGYVCRGEKLVAATTHSMLNDKYYGQWLAMHKPFNRLEQFVEEAPEVLEKVPEKYRNFALCLHHAPEYWCNDARITDGMELEAHSKAHIETILSKVKAQRHIVQRYLSGEIAVTEILPSDDEGAEANPNGQAKPKPKLTHSQKRLRKAIEKQLENAMRAAQAEDDGTLDACVEEAGEHRMLFASGPPGTGKTFVVHEMIREAVAGGARVLFGLPTGQLASEIRALHPNIDVDTNHGAFLLHRDLQEAVSIMTQYDLVIIDEVSMLTDEHFEHILALWKYAEQLPCVVLLGDFWQLPVVDKQAQRCECSPAWATHVRVIPFHEQVRCKCPALQQKLDVLRTGVPSMKFLKKKILRGHRAWKTNVPTAWDIVGLFREHEDTTVVTTTRKATATINQLAVEAFFEGRHKTPLGTVGLDYETNVDNYDAKGKLKAGRLEAAQTTVYEGMRVYLTQNINKENDFVNGMAGTVLDYDARSRCLEVFTRTKQRLAVHMVTKELDDGRKVTCFPVRLGYACTVPKVQGMTLPHITLWLDKAGCKAAAYVAMSRVQRDEEYLIAGKVCPAHFVPAQ